MTPTRTRSRSTRPVPRSSPDPNRRSAPGPRSASHRSAISSAGRSRFCTTASTTPATFHAKAGPRMGPHPAAVASTREGSKSEIIRPVLLDPWRGLGGRRFRSVVRRTDPATPDRPRARPARTTTYPSWPASLRTGWLKHRAAQLQVSASPSFNVTVLELIPATPRRTGNRSFLRVGLPVIEELARRLECHRYQQLLEEGNDGRIRDR